MADEQRDLSYLDENLSTREKESGRTRLPMPEQEGKGKGKDSRDTLNPDQPDEFGDGDRRS